MPAQKQRKPWGRPKDPFAFEPGPANRGRANRLRTLRGEKSLDVVALEIGVSVFILRRAELGLSRISSRVAELLESHYREPMLALLEPVKETA